MTKQASVPPRRSQELLDEEPCRVAGGSLVMYGYDGKPAARYHLEDAWSGGQGHLRSHRAGPRPRRRGPSGEVTAVAQRFRARCYAADSRRSNLLRAKIYQADCQRSAPGQSRSERGSARAPQPIT